MPSRASLSLLLLLAAGCAAEKLVVEDADWKTVPAPQRAKLDRQSQADLDAARTEAKLAAKSLAETERAAPDAKAAAGKPGAPPTGGGNAAWATENAQHDRARGQALTKIDTAMTSKRRAELVWHQRWVEAANDRIDMVLAQRELTRGQAVDRNLLGEDTYETAPLRGQFSKAQVRWYTAAGAADKARDDFERATRALTTAKEAYAELMKNGPGNSMADASTEAAAPKDPLQLPSWSVTRFDIRRKNGMRHFIDTTVSTSQMRTPRLHISPQLLSAKATGTADSAEVAPPPKAPATAAKTAAATPAATASAPPTKPAPTAKPPTVATKAWDDVPATHAPAPKPSPTSAAKPVEP